MAAIEIIDAFEEEYYPMSFDANGDRARDFTNGWCAAKAAEVQKPSHNTASMPCPLWSKGRTCKVFNPTVYSCGDYQCSIGGTQHT